MKFTKYKVTLHMKSGATLIGRVDNITSQTTASELINLNGGTA